MNANQLQEYADNAILTPTTLSELRSYPSNDGTPVFRVEHGEDL